MYEELFKDLLKLKLKAADRVLSLLPANYREKAYVLERGILKAIYDVTLEHIEENTTCKSKNSTKSIKIE